MSAPDLSRRRIWTAFPRIVRSISCSNSPSIMRRPNVSSCGENGRDHNDAIPQFLPRFNIWAAAAHRVAYIICVEEIPKDGAPHENVVRHSCDNPPCCNPKHLILGTQGQNVADMIARGRKAVLAGEEHQNSRFSWDSIQKIRSDDRGYSAIARDYQTAPSVIRNIKIGKSWRPSLA